MNIDVIAFAPHPDDAEMACGGFLAKAKDMGYSTGIIDLSLGELSTNGDPETREKETREATRILGLDLRKNLEIPDGNISNTEKNHLKVIDCLREYRPKIVITPFERDRHPDHENAFKLLKDSIFLSGLKKLKTGQPPYRPGVVINYMLGHEFTPSFVVDISGYYEKKMKAIKAFRSQIYCKEEKKDKTYISTKYFYDFLHNRDKCFGLKVFTDHGEPYYIESALKVDDPVKFFEYLIK
jgi:bacillithiol biosynthesis deacetylase BshB1